MIATIEANSVAFDLADPLVMHPARRTFRDPGGGMQGIALCEIGHQGKTHDEAVGLTHWNARYYDSGLGRFITHDPHPDIYPDGMNAYAAYHMMHGLRDPSGLQSLGGGLVKGSQTKTNPAGKWGGRNGVWYERHQVKL